MSDDCKTKELYWACLRYARFWMLYDGIWCREIALNGLNEDVLREIAKNYGVMRGIREATSSTTSSTVSATGDRLARLCNLLNEEAKNWPKTLIDRAKACEAIVCKAEKENCFSNFQGSAVTKFMWFLKPEGWTMFDKYAANGLGINAVGARGERMRAFYSTLHGLGFERLSQDMQAVIDASPEKGLPATRILDTLLMMRGGRGHDARAMRESEHYLALLPEASAKSLRDVAEKLQDQFGDDLPKKPDLKAA